MKTNNGKKTAVITAAGVGAVALLGAGALALFSDLSDTATGGSAGTVSVAVVNPDLQNKSNINPGDNDANMWASLYKNDERHYIPTAEDPLFNANASHDVDDYDSYVTVATTPHDLTFTVANTGTKSIRTRQTFIVSVYQVDKDDEGKTSADFLPANVFTLYEDGTYYGTKNQDILDVKDSTDYKSATTTNKFVEEYKTALDGTDVDSGRIVDAYTESVADGMTQPWEELAYKYYIDGDDNEWLVAVPNSDLLHTKVGGGDLPTADDVEEVPFGTLIKAVKYVVYSDIFDGVTDNSDEFEAELEGAFGEMSNLGNEDVNVSVIPDAYHVTSSLMCDNKYAGSERVYYKDQNGNVQVSTADGTQFFFWNEEKNLFIACEDGSLTGVDANGAEVTVDFKEGEYLVGMDAAQTYDALKMFAVELNTEIDADGNIVFTDSLVDANGNALEDSVRVPLVHAYNAKTYTYMLGMSKMSTNKYQGATVTIDVVVEAMQYRNTDGLADWEAISTNTITTALDFTDNKDTHTSITVPDKEEEPMHKDELVTDGNETDDAIEGDAYVGENEFTRQ
jgi:hypothetical protein